MSSVVQVQNQYCQEVVETLTFIQLVELSYLRVSQREVEDLGIRLNALQRRRLRDWDIALK